MMCHFQTTWIANLSYIIAANKLKRKWIWQVEEEIIELRKIVCKPCWSQSTESNLNSIQFKLNSNETPETELEYNIMLWQLDLSTCIFQRQDVRNCLLVATVHCWHFPVSNINISLLLISLALPANFIMSLTLRWLMFTWIQSWTT